MDKIKILWIGDGVAPTGFGRVNHSIIRNLNPKYEVHHLAINYNGDPHWFEHKIYPAGAGGDVYGYGRLMFLIEGLRPDLIFILNDAWMIDHYLQIIRDNLTGYRIPIVTYFPVDAEEHDTLFYKNFDMVDSVCVYTNFAKDVLLDAKPEFIHAKDIKVIPHGISKELFFPVDTTTAKEIIYPKDRTDEFLNSFIILNANRNQPRKRPDITLRAFSEFQKDKADVKLFMHCGMQDMGISILRIANRLDFYNKLIVTTQEPFMPNVADNQLNLMYNATEIGLNTGIGEGWGLTSWEHGATGKPQIVPRHSALEEIWADDRAYFIDIIGGDDGKWTMDAINTVGKIPSTKSLVDVLNFAYNDWKFNASQENLTRARRAVEYINLPKFEWENVAKEFEKVFEKALKKYNRL